MVQSHALSIWYSTSQQTDNENKQSTDQSVWSFLHRQRQQSQQHAGIVHDALLECASCFAVNQWYTLCTSALPRGRRRPLEDHPTSTRLSPKNQCTVFLSMLTNTTDGTIKRHFSNYKINTVFDDCLVINNASFYEALWANCKRSEIAIPQHT